MRQLVNMSGPVAKKVVALVLEGVDTLCASASVVRENCDATTFDTYQRAIATAIADVGDTVLEPIFRQHPQLRPWDVDGQTPDS